MSTLGVRGAQVADGTGAALVVADVLVRDGRVAEVGRVDVTAADRVVDADGLVLAPGFVDVHSHADNAPLLTEPDESKLTQGVTTEVVGNCGFSLAPCDPSRRDELASLAARVFPALDFTWTSTDDLYGVLDGHGYVVNAAPLVGHQALRVAAMGSDDRPPTPAELDAMRAGLAEALDAGAFGLSSGLIYPPGLFAATDELVALASVLPPGRVYTSHVRGEGLHVRDSVAEAIEVGERAGRPVQVSHLKAAGRAAWGAVPDLLGLMDAATARGVVVHHDVYPYTAGSTMLSSCLPPWFQDGGHDAVLRRLHDPAALERAERELEVEDGSWQNWVAGCGWSGIVVASSTSHRHDGQDLERIAADRGLRPFEALTTVLAEERLAATMVVFAMDEADVRAAVAHPRAMIGSDSLPPGRGGRPHPRTWGTFPRVLARYVRDDALFDLPEAIHRMTGLAATGFGIPDRGFVRPGAVADLVLLDPATVEDRATYEEPERAAVGIEMVLLAGEVALEDGVPTGVRAGRRLRPAEP